MFHFLEQSFGVDIGTNCRTCYKQRYLHDQRYWYGCSPRNPSRFVRQTSDHQNYHLWSWRAYENFGNPSFYLKHKDISWSLGIFRLNRRQNKFKIFSSTLDPLLGIGKHQRKIRDNKIINWRSKLALLRCQKISPHSTIKCKWLYCLICLPQ